MRSSINNDSYPLLSNTVTPNADGAFPVEWTFRNTSSSAAINADVWIAVCADCSIASEPEGFERLKGMAENERHRLVPLLNPGTAMEKATILVKVKHVTTKFVIGFHYACQSCSKNSTQVQLLTVVADSGLGTASR